MFVAASAKALPLSTAKKAAYQRACESAFSRLYIVCLSSGKVWCEMTQGDDGINTSLPHLDNPEIEDNLLTVNEVLPNPGSDIEEEALIDIAEIQDLLDEFRDET